MTKNYLLRTFLWVVGLSIAISSTSFAQRAFPCASCQSCSTALAAPDAKVVLSGDIIHEGEGPCITILGERAQLDGAEHDIRPISGEGTIGVLVDANDVLIKNLHVVGAETGIHLKSTQRTTVFHAWIQSTTKGISVNGASAFRLTRSVLLDNQFGVSFGNHDAEGTCHPPSTFNSVGAVINKVHIELSKVGILACDAVPVIKNSTLVRNKIGASLAHPKGDDSRPTDPCACSPGLDGVKAGTAMFFSSGCHSCQIHEDWMPELKSAGHDFLMRPTGPGNRAKMLIYDAFIDQCLPQLTDAVGIPGCVPNYGCLTSDATNKVRSGEKNLEFEMPLASSEDLASYQSACQVIADRSYGTGKDCVRHQLQDNIVCMNTEVDLQGVSSLSKWGGINNACGKTRGFKTEESIGCTQACPTEFTTPTIPDSWKVAFLDPPPPTRPTPSAVEKPEEPEEEVEIAEATPDREDESNAKTALQNTPPEKEDEPSEATSSEDTPCCSAGWLIILLGLLVSGVVLWRIRRGKTPNTSNESHTSG